MTLPPSQGGRERAAFVDELAEWLDLRRARAVENAARLSLPIDGTLPDGGAFALVDFEDGRPLHRSTTNFDAAISTAADRVRDTAPFSVDGTDVTLGIWDGGRVRLTHQEFGGRVLGGDSTTTLSSHATHVAGTMVAAGVDPLAKGMSPGAGLLSFDWTSDLAEMAAVGAMEPGDSGAIPISNHSYTFVGGWRYMGTSSPYRWLWYGSYTPGGAQTSHVEAYFGRYSSDTAALDAVAAASPYYLPFLAAGNDRTDDPWAGDTWRTTTNATIYTYDPAVHPLGDGDYKGGYDCMMTTAIAKNVMAVGAVKDAVVSGAGGKTRSLAAAGMLSFSSWGPADDGRIKPDVVANGDALYSTTSTSNTSYGNSSGTSMASPNASGSAGLLVGLFAGRFAGSAMRASTLKGIIIHTADDLGNPGPDYRYGWGLMNTLAAAQVIDAHSIAPGARRVIEGRLTPAKTSDTFSFIWDGISAIRATLAWTDPPGTPKTGHDNRARDLVNDLDLLVTSPTGVQRRPFVMPHVGTWTTASLSAPATTGVNTVDTVEQVRIASPAEPGTYTVSVSLPGALTGDEQPYSLVVSGAGESLPAAAPAIFAASAPGGCILDAVSVTLDGAGFQLGGYLRLTRGGYPSVIASSSEVFADHARAWFDPGTAPGGLWNLEIVNPDGQTAVVPSAVEVPLTLLREDFENNGAGWTTSSSANGVNWGLTVDLYVSPTTSAFAPGSSKQSESSLFAPPAIFPAEATCHRLVFWHWFSLQSQKDAGVLEVSFDGGSTWSDITTAGGTFVQGGYNSTLNANNNPLGASGRPVWTGTTGNSFVKTEIALDPAVFGGQTARFRWRLGCDNNTASTGWVVDDVSIRSDVSGSWQPFDYWRHHTLGDALADETGDPDGNGLTLFGEYAFAAVPGDGSPTGVSVGVDAGGHLTITFPIRLEATDLVYTVQTAGGISETWVDAAAYTSDGDGVHRNTSTVTEQVSVVADGARIWVTERHALPISAEPQRFLKVVVTRADLP